ncbi:MAG: TasA family protein [Nitrososphaerales archaeon]
MSIFMIGLVASLAGLGASLYFSDTETSTDNIFTAGTLDLKVDDQDDPIAAYFEVDDVAPSDDGEVAIMLTNAGSEDGDGHS